MFGLSSALLGVPRRPQPGDPDYDPSVDVNDKFARMMAANDASMATMPERQADADLSKRMFGPVLPGDNQPGLLAPQPAARPLMLPGALRNPAPADVLTQDREPNLGPLSFLPSLSKSIMNGTLPSSRPELEPAPMGSLPATMTQPPMSPDPNFVRTFTGSQGTTSYDMTPNAGKYIGTGISARGTPFAADLGQGKELFAQQLAQAAKAASLGDPHTQTLMALEELKNHHAIHGKLMDMAAGAAARVVQDTGDMTEGKKEYDRWMGMFQSTNPSGAAPSTLPGALKPSATPEVDPIERIRQANEKATLDSVKSIVGTQVRRDPQTGAVVSTTLPDYSGQKPILDLSNAIKNAGTPELRKKLIDTALSSTSDRRALTDAVVRQAVADLTTVGGPAGEGSDLPGIFKDTKFNMPFELRGEPGPAGFLSRIPNLLTGNPEAFYNRAVLPDNRVVDLPKWALKGILTRGTQTQGERQDAENRLKQSHGPLLEALLGPEIKNFWDSHRNKR